MKWNEESRTLFARAKSLGFDTIGELAELLKQLKQAQ